VGLHYGKHHASYFTMLNTLTRGTPFADMSLEQVVVASATPEHRKIFNQAGQAWNHIVYWEQMRPGGAKAPGGRLAQMIERDLGGVAKMKEDFVKGATSDVFGSGWYWLAMDGDKLVLTGTSNGDNPLAHGMRTLMGVDVWEHAYYLDYQNRRADHVKAVLDNLINWDYVAERMAA
jgi:superoxide dismutase, Fe-Mn family